MNHLPTPLAVLAYHGRLAELQQRLQEKEIQSSALIAALEDAADGGQAACLAALLSHQEASYPPHVLLNALGLAVDKGHVECTRRLLEANPPPSPQFTDIFLAQMPSHPPHPCVVLLVEAMPDVPAAWDECVRRSMGAALDVLAPRMPIEAWQQAIEKLSQGTGPLKARLQCHLDREALTAALSDPAPVRVSRSMRL